MEESLLQMDELLQALCIKKVCQLVFPYPVYNSCNPISRVFVKAHEVREFFD